MIKVPVFDSFNNNRVIGELSIDETQLPATPEFVFTLGYQCESKQDTAGSVPTEPHKGPYRLVAVAITRDADYAGYLDQVGVFPSDETRSARG